MLAADPHTRELRGLMHDITHRIFGSPETILQSADNINGFKAKLSSCARFWSSSYSFWSWYITRPSRMYLELLHHVYHNSPGPSTYSSPSFALGGRTFGRLLDDVDLLHGLSAGDMERLVLPLIEHVHQAPVASLVQALYRSKQQAEAAQQTMRRRRPLRHRLNRPQKRRHAAADSSQPHAAT